MFSNHKTEILMRPKQVPKEGHNTPAGMLWAPYWGQTLC